MATETNTKPATPLPREWNIAASALTNQQQFIPVRASPGEGRLTYHEALDFIARNKAYPELVAALRVIAQQPFGGEVIGYGPKRTEAFRHGFNVALGRVHGQAQALLAKLGEGA